MTKFNEMMKVITSSGELTEMMKAAQGFYWVPCESEHPDSKSIAMGGLRFLSPIGSELKINRHEFHTSFRLLVNEIYQVAGTKAAEIARRDGKTLLEPDARIINNLQQLITEYLIEAETGQRYLTALVTDENGDPWPEDFKRVLAIGIEGLLFEIEDGVYGVGSIIGTSVVVMQDDNIVAQQEITNSVSDEIRSSKED